MKLHLLGFRCNSGRLKEYTPAVPAFLSVRARCKSISHLAASISAYLLSKVYYVS